MSRIVELYRVYPNKEIHPYQNKRPDMNCNPLFTRGIIFLGTHGTLSITRLTGAADRFISRQNVFTPLGGARLEIINNNGKITEREVPLLHQIQLQTIQAGDNMAAEEAAAFVQQSKIGNETFYAPLYEEGLIQKSENPGTVFNSSGVEGMILLPSGPLYDREALEDVHRRLADIRIAFIALKDVPRGIGLKIEEQKDLAKHGYFKKK